MPVSFSFLPGTTAEQARSLLHRIGGLPDVETFADAERGPAVAGRPRPVVVFERSCDTAEEDEGAREQIAQALRKSPFVDEIEKRSS
jgi:hypothetical protein